MAEKSRYFFLSKISSGFWEIEIEVSKFLSALRHRAVVHACEVDYILVAHGDASVHARTHARLRCAGDSGSARSFGRSASSEQSIDTQQTIKFLLRSSKGRSLLIDKS